MSATKKCPECQRDDALATIENVQVFRERAFIDNNGPVGEEGHEENDSYDSEIVGVVCLECFWRYEGQDWMDKLLS